MNIINYRTLCKDYRHFHVVPLMKNCAGHFLCTTLTATEESRGRRWRTLCPLSTIWWGSSQSPLLKKARSRPKSTGSSRWALHCRSALCNAFHKYFKVIYFYQYNKYITNNVYNVYIALKLIISVNK